MGTFDSQQTWNCLSLLCPLQAGMDGCSVGCSISYLVTDAGKGFECGGGSAGGPRRAERVVRDALQRVDKGVSRQQHMLPPAGSSTEPPSGIAGMQVTRTHNVTSCKC